MKTVKTKDFRPMGFTLVEMMVVLAIVGLLTSLLLPAIQSARKAARRASCVNNMRQNTLAMLQYETAFRHLPPSWTRPLGTNNGWSAQALILPFLEKENLFQEIDFRQSYSKFPAVSAHRIETFLCPSEYNTYVRAGKYSPLNYAVNMGVWFVYDPQEKVGGEGVFFPDSNIRTVDILDGTTHTLAMAEVKTYNPYFRNAALSETDISDKPKPTDLCSLGGQFKTNSGHTEWVDGRVHQTGFTTVFTPNTDAICRQGREQFNVDWTNQQEGKSDTVPTYAAVTARSHHPGGVNVAMVDASIHFVADDIKRSIWRALSTRMGGESSGQLR